MSQWDLFAVVAGGSVCRHSEVSPVSFMMVRVKPCISLVFGDWAPPALVELAGGFVLTAHAVRSQASVKILEGWRYSKDPALPLGSPLQSTTLAEIPWDKILIFSVENNPSAEEEMLPLCLHPSFPLCSLSHSRVPPHFQQRAQRANLQLWGQAKPAAVQIYQPGWQGCSQPLGSVRRVTPHPQEDP